MMKMKRETQQMLMCIAEKRDICSLFVGVQIAAVTKETGVEVPP